MKNIKDALKAIDSALELIAQIKGDYITTRDRYDIDHPDADHEENPFNSALDNICEAWTDARYARNELSRVFDFLQGDECRAALRDIGEADE